MVRAARANRNKVRRRGDFVTQLPLDLLHKFVGFTGGCQTCGHGASGAVRLCYLTTDYMALEAHVLFGGGSPVAAVVAESFLTYRRRVTIVSSMRRFDGNFDPVSAHSSARVTSTIALKTMTSIQPFGTFPPNQLQNAGRNIGRRLPRNWPECDFLAGSVFCFKRRRPNRSM